jgi:hypothetical protein
VPVNAVPGALACAAAADVQPEREQSWGRDSAGAEQMTVLDCALRREGPVRG